MNRLFLILLLYFPFTINAQIVYSAADFAEIGDAQLLSQANGGLDDFDFSATGSFFFWDFADLPVDNQNTEEYVDPNNAGYQFAWCLSNGFFLNCQSQFANLTNIATTGLDTLNLGPIAAQNVVNHFRKGDGAYAATMLGLTAEVGGVPLPITFEYENRDTILQFPLEYGNTDSSVSRLNFDLTGLNLPFNQSFNSIRTNTVDGWGSLTTPYGTFDQTLKVRTVIEHFDTTFLEATTIPIERTSIEYRWFALDYPTPVLQATGIIVGGQETINQIAYVDSLRCLQPNPLFYFLPLTPEYDPETQSATVSFFNLSGNADSLVWDFGDGVTSNQFNPEHNFLCPGPQNVTLISYNTVCDPLAADTLTLPVLISDPTDPDTSLVSICSGDSLFINGSWEMESGLYESNLVSLNGCDSTSFVQLSIVENIDQTLSVDGIELTANQTGALYQWIDCDTGLDIAGANGNSFTPEVTGNYGVVITVGSCEATSVCENIIISSQSEPKQLLSIEVWPNPSQSEITVQLPPSGHRWEVNLMDINGKIITQTIEQPAGPLDLVLPPTPGVYLLRVIDTTGQIGTARIIKQ